MYKRFAALARGAVLVLPAAFAMAFACIYLNHAHGQTDQIQFHSDGTIDPNSRTYMYAHSAVHDPIDGFFKVYSCGGVAGDYIVLKRSQIYEDLASAPWEHVLAPSRKNATFDRSHTCDPKTFEHDGIFYLVYGGLDEESVPICDRVTRIGIAASNNRGRTFTRLFGGQPIISENSYVDGRKMTGVYGVGQPAVVKAPDGYFYMIYSEIFGPLGPECASLPWAHNPAENRHIESKLHLIRCPVPSFQKDLQEHVRTYLGHEIGGVSVDLAFNRGRQHLEVIVNGTNGSGQARVRMVHLDLDGNIVPDPVQVGDHATVYEANREYEFGEGVAVVTTPSGDIIPWSDGSGSSRRMHLNFIGTTFGPNRYGEQNQHITGPVKFTRFTEGIQGTLSDFSHVGEKSLRGDLDGDGVADLIVLDPMTFIWRYKLSSEGFNSTHTLQWGLPGLDEPIVVRDWNRDGKDEIAVFRMGIWYIHHAGVWPFAEYDTVNWGWAGDYPFSGDTNGDGKSELIVWRPSNGYWYINKSGSWPNVDWEGVQYGLFGDSPALKDVDQNGRDDLLVWRISNSTTYVRHR